MTDIPDDIREKAEKIIAEYFGDEEDRPIWTTRDSAIDILSSAIVAERLATEKRVREECAKIAEADAASRSEMEGYGTAKSAGHRIADAIREGRKC